MSVNRAVFSAKSQGRPTSLQTSSQLSPASPVNQPTAATMFGHNNHANNSTRPHPFATSRAMPQGGPIAKVGV